MDNQVVVEVLQLLEQMVEILVLGLEQMVVQAHLTIF